MRIPQCTNRRIDKAGESVCLETPRRTTQAFPIPSRAQNRSDGAAAYGDKDERQEGGIEPLRR
ncbi:hypothetical protein EGR_02028 [Echinococcus granulosus]|uniref:Uncharacterized protein n=1 Tax=Echinococcus granulosus TaxID=6210 RepID=W6V9E4_ECHGR|nr:hypothetical protein EGR_02028 [Echinococcus granulosus]EUB63224.1 hypothetical protein EGR_02028 [Echinococcus granulosus]